MKICILTQPLRTNYGGLLQTYALQQVLKRMGHEVSTDINGTNRSSALPLKIRLLQFCIELCKQIRSVGRKKNVKVIDASINTDRFIVNHINTVDFFKNAPAPSEEMLSRYDSFIIGSDQVWRRGFDTPAYFCDFLKGRYDKTRIAYAASFGVNKLGHHFSPQIIKECREGLREFKAVSVREDSAVKICKEIFDKQATHVLDPTLLLDKNDYLKLIENDDIKIKNNSLFCYILDNNETKQEIINKSANGLGLSVYDIMSTTRDNNSFPSVSAWISGFRDAKFVVTDSFHGTVFSIIFNKPFIAIDNAGRGSARFLSLLRIFGLENRLISSTNEITKELLQKIDYTNVNAVLFDWKQKSINFLNKNLN